jgi:flap endonuclease-1
MNNNFFYYSSFSRKSSNSNNTNKNKTYYSNSKWDQHKQTYYTSKWDSWTNYKLGHAASNTNTNTNPNPNPNRVNSTTSTSTMGVKGLTKLLMANAPDSVRTVDAGLVAYRGKKIAFDASMYIYQFMTSVRTDAGELLRDPSGNPTSHLHGMVSRVVRLLEAGVMPVFVFDGAAPVAKGELLAKRREARMANHAKAMSAPDAETAAVFHKRSYSLSEAEVRDCKRLLALMGVPVVEAPGEAEAQCARMCRDGLVHAVASEDMDTLAFGAPILVRNMFGSSVVAGSSKHAVTEIHLAKAIEQLKLEGGMPQFVDLCILCGCDYCGTIPGIGPVRALQRIRECGNIDGVLAALHKTPASAVTHEKMSNFKYQEARNLLLNPNVHPRSSLPELDWSAKPDVEGLKAYLVAEKGFAEARVERMLERLGAGMKARGQMSIEDMFAFKNN